MAGRLTEEKVTKSILIWLERTGWKILSFDFPQSGTGVILHPNSEIRELTKNKGSFIPDIVAVKENKAVFFENKDRFVLNDFDKINSLREKNDYSVAISGLLKKHEVEKIFYGVGLPNNVSESKIRNYLQMTDFVVFVESDSEIRVEFQTKQIFSNQDL